MRFVPARHREGLSLVAFDDAARDFMRRISNAEPFEVEVLNDRDMIEHRKIFAQIADVAKALQRSPDAVRAQLLFETGNFQHLGEMFGKTFIAVNSMSRNAMSDRELHTFWKEAKDVLRNKLLPGVADAAERHRLAAMLSP